MLPMGRLLGLLIWLFPLAALSQEAPCDAPAAMDDGWAVVSPDLVGFDAATLCGIGPRFRAWTAANVHSVLVVRHGKLVYEQYFAGEDERLGRPLGVVHFDATMQHDLRSIHSTRRCGVGLDKALR